MLTERVSSPARTSGAPPATPETPTDPALARRTELVLRELDALPTLPSIAMRLLQLGSNEDVDIKEIVRVIETDPTLTARLLALCRKASTRTRHPITTVEMAVVMLGLDAVRSLVLSVQIFDWTTRLQRRPEPGTLGRPGPRPASAPGSLHRSSASSESQDTGGFDRVGFWQHSVAVACAAELIAREHPNLGFHAEEAFVCGLLHDVGKLALELVLPKAYARVVELTEQRGAPMAETERIIAGLNHCDAGARLADSWGLPGIIRDSIALHHSAPDSSISPSHRKMVALVSIADELVRRMSLGWSGSHAPPGDMAELCNRGPFDIRRVESLAERLYEATSSRCRDLGLGDEPSQQLLVNSILRANARLAQLNQEMVVAKERLERTQEELSEAKSLARLGQMTAGAAHEMNNPLAVISGRAQALIGRQKDERDKASAQAIVEAAQRLSQLIARLNRIASPPQPRREPVGLAELLGDAVSRAKARNAARLNAAGIAPPFFGVKILVPEGLPACAFDRELMTDAFVEILVNALEANPRAGVDIRVQTDASDDRLYISVVDDGAGMSPTALAHALDPFFSEKAAGRQTGLGLALAHRLIQLHEGDLELSSTPGSGTTVTISLNRWRADRSAQAEESRAVAA